MKVRRIREIRDVCRASISDSSLREEEDWDGRWSYESYRPSLQHFFFILDLRRARSYLMFAGRKDKKRRIKLEDTSIVSTPTPMPSVAATMTTTARASVEAGHAIGSPSASSAKFIVPGSGSADYLGWVPCPRGHGSGTA